MVALLDQYTDPGRPGVHAPEVTVADHALHLGPSLLTRKHWLRYTVLLDGEPEFTCAGNLVDVTIRERPLPAYSGLLGAAGSLAMGVFLLLALIPTFVEHPQLALNAAVAVLLSVAVVLAVLLPNRRQIREARAHRAAQATGPRAGD
ncbi:hypothetical protein K7G98_24450 [Saccharothrix sp. MB29]|nr:hypothetical protein [Saccharothrix sp. MB29]